MHTSPPRSLHASLVGSYRFCPLCGSPALSRERGFLECGACGHRDFNNPVTAVAVFITDESDRVLLIRRAREPGLGKWAPPGGFVDAGETLEHAAIREVIEETGVVPGELHYLGSFPNEYVYQGFSRPVCDVFFRGRVPSQQVRLAPGEASDARWLPATGVDPGSLAFDSMRRAYELFLCAILSA